MLGTIVCTGRPLVSSRDRHALVPSREPRCESAMALGEVLSLARMVPGDEVQALEPRIGRDTFIARQDEAGVPSPAHLVELL